MAQMSEVPLTEGQMSDDKEKQMLRARKRRNSFDYRQRQKQKKSKEEQLIRSLQVRVESLIEEIWKNTSIVKVMQTKVNTKWGKYLFFCLFLHNILQNLLPCQQSKRSRVFKLPNHS
jgi:hypothetical protein